VIPRILVDEADIPGGGTLKLFRRGAEYSIMLGGNELMNSRLSGSEEALAGLACDRIGGRTAPRILIGGLGMGFTLRTALARLGEDARIAVAELVPAVIAWARGPLAPIHGASLDDPRVEIVEDDVAHLVADRPCWDAILLDVDNGPDGISVAGNDRLYDYRGLRAAKAALSPGGVLAIWSAASDAAFTARLREVGFSVEEVRTRARGDRGAHHMIWLATAPAHRPRQ
jgi:spermidine synthase